MITSIVAGLMFFVSIFSMFVIPQGFFGSFEEYCHSIVARCIASIVFLLVASFPIFGKGQVLRYFAACGLALGISVTASTLWMYAEMKLGSVVPLAVAVAMAMVSLVYIQFFEKRKEAVVRA